MYVYICVCVCIWDISPMRFDPDKDKSDGCGKGRLNAGSALAILQHMRQNSIVRAGSPASPKGAAKPSPFWRQQSCDNVGLQCRSKRSCSARDLAFTFAIDSLTASCLLTPSSSPPTPWNPGVFKCDHIILTIL